MRLLRLSLVLLPAGLVIALDLPSVSSGIFLPGITRSAPSCGRCHNPTPGAATGFPRIEVALLPSVRSLGAGHSITVTITARGGQTASSDGGFACDATAGTFSAGQGTSVVPPGHAITHSDSRSRSWTFGYTAPAQPGVVEMYAVCNTVNGDLNYGPEDMWAFHGADDQDTRSTPVRLFVNAAGIENVGRACAGAFGNVPVLGAAQVPAVGNAAFAFEVLGAVSLAAVGVLLGAGLFPQPVDLGFLGGAGCELYFAPLVTLPGATGSGTARYGEGVAQIAAPIPGDPALRGGLLHAQAWVHDPGSGRPLPLTLSNALAVTFQ